MNPNQASKITKRGVGSIVAGLLATAIPPSIVDAVLHATGIYSPAGEAMNDGLFLLALGYRILFTIGGAYLTARIATTRRMGHVVVLGAIGMLLGTMGLVATWNQGPEFGPKWYPIALIVLAIPCTWAGGRLQGRTRSGRTALDAGLPHCA
ncbi:hypothetical protein LZC95_48090 [Pendulispora brunnea]|uniref:Uncharacterized protein n=1 Tax=Pendulispora brunnea TaxID=2905690 RepID=A0ABZ2KBD6_9BACT